MTKSWAAESRVVERARIILVGLEGKEIKQAARELKVVVPTVSKWSQRFPCACVGMLST
jgi:transposase